MATFTDDEFLVALDDLHAVDLGIKKLVAKMKELKPDWTEGITAKVVREAVAVIRAPDGAAAVAAARQRVPKTEEPPSSPEEPPSSPEECVHSPSLGLVFVVAWHCLSFLSLSLSLSCLTLFSLPILPARAPLTLDDTLSLLRADPRPWSRSRQPWRWQRHRWKRPRSQTTSSS